MLVEWTTAVLERLAQIPGVATCERYAGQLAESARATIRVPAVLLAVGEWRAEPDPGTGEVDVELHCSAFVAARNARGPEARAQDVDALCEALLPVVRLNCWGLAPRVGAARLDRVAPHYGLESQGVGVREVRWRQSLRLGDSIWDGGVLPSGVWVGWVPRVGADHEPDYEQVADPEHPAVPVEWE
jgi:hypothetical protein